MLLMNTSDDVLSHSAGTRPPMSVNGEERIAPPHVYIFEPGEVQEVPDDVGGICMNHLEPRGLVRFRHGDDLAAVTRTGRYRWFVFLRQQVERMQALNDSQRAKGLGVIRPNDDVVKATRHYLRLKKLEFTDEIPNAMLTTSPTSEELELLMGKPADTEASERTARQSAEGTP